MSVQEYLDKHMLSRKIEDAVNAAVRAKTPDPVLFISNHMRKVVPSVITKIKGRQILDSRGIPTVEVDLFTNKGSFRASVPSGHVTGMYEAVELRDGDKGMYLGNSVTRAVKNINEKISEALIGMDPTLQSQIDQAMIDLDKTEKKGQLGANAMLAVSIAACKAGAAEKEIPLYKHISDLSGKTNLTLPVPAFTVISGGKHAGNNLAIQEIMILPIGASRFEEALQMGSETYHHLKAVIKEKYGEQGCNVGEDGGFSPNLSSVQEGLNLVKEAISRTGYGEKIKMAIDVAATTFCMGTKYDLDYKFENKSGQNFKSGDDMIKMYEELCAAYPIVSIEDPFDKEDWEHVKRLSDLGLCQVVGDALLMSNHKRIERAIHESSCTALLLKVNQIGTVTEALEVVKLAKDAHWGVVVSHRSGETEDSFIADLSVGLAMGQIKTGAPCRGERLAKYNQLLRIEEELGDQAVYAGEDWRAT
ncbi:cytosolic enolase 3 [Populus alba]|uniref:phosphopyruvate hydratase n=1 Tax=Populus alba TaxID=43335 RepID=A0A4U5P5W2_POPAL|nr:cytosolic enolase 3-like [Populus alba]TKR91727.1 cytosolic enolase 3-like isoform X2 [Populus alba]